jgi:hypothetical protein
VELYQRIEQLIGKKLPLYPLVEEEVMLLNERVTEAQRFARMVGIDGLLTMSVTRQTYHNKPTTTRKTKNKTKQQRETRTRTRTTTITTTTTTKQQ